MLGAALTKFGFYATLPLTSEFIYADRAVSKQEEFAVATSATTRAHFICTRVLKSKPSALFHTVM